jgi:hypothetical protein
LGVGADPLLYTEAYRYRGLLHERRFAPRSRPAMGYGSVYKGVVRTSFFCEATYKSTHYFSRSNAHPSPIEPKSCPMASKSSCDGHKSHPTPSQMSPLASVAVEAVNFAVGLMKQPSLQHDGGFEPLFRTRCAGKGDE